MLRYDIFNMCNDMNIGFWFVDIVTMTLAGWKDIS